jgi:hypothetical protein
MKYEHLICLPDIMIKWLNFLMTVIAPNDGVGA